MSEHKTGPGNGDVGDFIAQLPDAKRMDSEKLIELMTALTGEPPVLWGTMVGFGQYHYRYDSGHQGDAFRIGFAPRKAALSIYLMGTLGPDMAERRDAMLARLGTHRMGNACLYVKRLADIYLAVLGELAVRSLAALEAHNPKP